MTKLKEAHKNEDSGNIDSAVEELNAAWQAASQHIYSQGQQDGAQPNEGAQQQGSNDNVADAEYEEVK